MEAELSFTCVSSVSSNVVNSLCVPSAMQAIQVILPKLAIHVALI